MSRSKQTIQTIHTAVTQRSDDAIGTCSQVNVTVVSHVQRKKELKTWELFFINRRLSSGLYFQEQDTGGV